MISVAELGRAVYDGELRVYYQPRFSISRGDAKEATKPPGTVEALLRWDGSSQIDQVIWKLEQHGMIREVTLFVITTACTHIRHLKSTVGCSPKVAINVSPVLFSDPWFIREARKIIEHHDISPELIEFEITESRLAHDIKTVCSTACSLRDDGFGIALDDFGTGFSGLQYLDMIPVTAIKIDRHFVSGLGERPTCNVIVANVARLALATGLTAVAEGTETQEHMNIVRDMGYDEVQGFLMAKPMPLSELIVFLMQFVHDHPVQENVIPLHSRLIASC